MSSSDRSSTSDPAGEDDETDYKEPNLLLERLKQNSGIKTGITMLKKGKGFGEMMAHEGLLIGGDMLNMALDTAGYVGKKGLDIGNSAARGVVNVVKQGDLVVDEAVLDALLAVHHSQDEEGDMEEEGEKKSSSNIPLKPSEVIAVIEEEEPPEVKEEKEELNVVEFSPPSRILLNEPIEKERISKFKREVYLLFCLLMLIGAGGTFWFGFASIDFCYIIFVCVVMIRIRKGLSLCTAHLLQDADIILHRLAFLCLWFIGLIFLFKSSQFLLWEFWMFFPFAHLIGWNSVPANEVSS